MRTQGLVLLLIVGFLTACGSDTKTEPVTQNSPSDGGSSLRITSDYLLGTWTSECAADPARRDIYIKEYLTFDDEGNVSRETTSYLGFRCSVELYQTNLSGKFTFSANGEYSETRTKVSFIVRSDTGRNIMNQGFCNKKDWKTSTNRDYIPYDFSDVHQCGVSPSVKFRLRGLKDSNASTLTLRQCEPGNDKDCTEMNYTRNY